MKSKLFNWKNEPESEGSKKRIEKNAWEILGQLRRFDEVRIDLWDSAQGETMQFWFDGLCMELSVSSNKCDGGWLKVSVTEGAPK